MVLLYSGRFNATLLTKLHLGSAVGVSSPHWVSHWGHNQALCSVIFKGKRDIQGVELLVVSDSQVTGLLPSMAGCSRPLTFSIIY